MSSSSLKRIFVPSSALYEKRKKKNCSIRKWKMRNEILKKKKSNYFFDFQLKHGCCLHFKLEEEKTSYHWLWKEKEKRKKKKGRKKYLSIQFLQQLYLLLQMFWKIPILVEFAIGKRKIEKKQFKEEKKRKKYLECIIQHKLNIWRKISFWE